MADEIEYKLEHVSATKVASEDIDPTFRSSCIGPYSVNPWPLKHRMEQLTDSVGRSDLRCTRR